jgi:hypothetical protein
MCAVGSEPADVYVHLDYFFEHNEEVVKYVSGVAKAVSGQVDSAPSKPSSGSVSSVVVRPAATGSQTSSHGVAASSTEGTAAQAAQTGGAMTGAAGLVVVNGGLMAVVVGIAAALV